MVQEVLYDNRRHIVCRPCTPEALHEMAAHLGLKRCWYHSKPYPHYDMPKRWADDFGYFLDQALLNLDIVGIPYRQASKREILIVARGK